MVEKQKNWISDNSQRRGKVKILLISAVSLLIGFGLGSVDGQESKAGKKNSALVMSGPAFQYAKGPPPNSSTKKVFARYISGLEDAGFFVKMLQPASGVVTFYLADTEYEKRGLFGFEWLVQYGATATYYKVGDGWQMGLLSVKAWDKPPAVGGWKMIPVTPEKQAILMKALEEFKK